MDEVVLESDRDKNNIIKDIEELLAEKELLEKVSFINYVVRKKEVSGNHIYLYIQFRMTIVKYKWHVGDRRVNKLFINLGTTNAYFN